MMKNRQTSLKASNFRNRVTFLENIAKDDTVAELWQEKFTSFAEIIAVSESKFESVENFDFGCVMTKGFFLLKMRFIKNITIKLRILFKERTFEIKRIIDFNQQDRFLQLIILEI